MVEHLFIGDITSMMSEEGDLDQILTFDAQVVLQTGTIRTSHLVTPSFSELLQTQQWQIVHHDDFESDSSLIGWNIPYKSYCDMKQKTINKHLRDTPQEEDHFLTTHCATQNNNLQKTFTTSPVHKHIKIQAEIHVFGDWAGENIAMLVNGKVAWTQTFHSSDPIDHQCPQLQALSVPVEAVIDTEDSTIILNFISTQKRHPCDGSFAIDDIIIYFK